MQYFTQQADNLRDRLLTQGYSKTLSRKAYNKALQQCRNSLLFNRKEDSITVKLITRCSTQHGHLRSLLRKHWHLLSEDHILSRYVRSTPKIVFRRAASLRAILSRDRKALRAQEESLDAATVHFVGSSGNILFDP